MYTYVINFKFSKDGKNWMNGSTTVKSDSEIGAIAQVENKYPYVSIIKIMKL